MENVDAARAWAVVQSPATRACRYACNTTAADAPAGGSEAPPDEVPAHPTNESRETPPAMRALPSFTSPEYDDKAGPARWFALGCATALGSLVSRSAADPVGRSARCLRQMSEPGGACTSVDGCPVVTPPRSDDRVSKGPHPAPDVPDRRSAPLSWLQASAALS